MNARYVQLVSRIVTYVLVALTAKLGTDMTETDLGPVADTVAVALVALGGLAFDIYLHRKQKNTPGDKQ